MFHLHCWHSIEGSEKKIASRSRCKKHKNSYISDGFLDMPHVKYTTQQKCCICEKQRESIVYRDFDIRRGLKYK